MTYTSDIYFRLKIIIGAKTNTHLFQKYYYYLFNANLSKDNMIKQDME